MVLGSGNSALKNFQDLLLHSSLIAIGPDVDLLDLRWNANVNLPIHAGHDERRTDRSNKHGGVSASITVLLPPLQLAASHPF